MYNDSNTREKILKKVRSALITKSETSGNIDFDSKIFSHPEEPLEILFAKQFSKVNGKFVYCENEKELLENLSSLITEHKWDKVFCFEEKAIELLKKAKITFSDDQKNIGSANVSISLCESLGARTGSILVSSRQSSGRRLPAFGNYHIVIAYSSQLHYTTQEGLDELKKRYKTEFPSMIINITGPSRTADIEKTLVQGAHGPKEIFVLLLEG